MHFAAARKDKLVSNMLLDSGSAIYHVHAGGSAFHNAARNGNLNMAKLLEEGIDINAATHSGDTSLHIVVKTEHHDIVTLPRR